MINIQKGSAEQIRKIQSEIEHLKLLIGKMEEALQNPFLKSDLRQKYKLAIPECHKKIKVLQGDIKAISMLEDLDPENIQLPKHYQHHPK